MYGLMISAREFSSDGPVEEIATPMLRTLPDTNSSKQKKHDEKTIYRPRVLRGVIKAKIIHREEITGGNRDGNELRGGLTTGRSGLGWTSAPGGEEPPDSVSFLFLSRDFSYLAKPIKILKEKFFANLF
jgi:hypothetical protein